MTISSPSPAPVGLPWTPTSWGNWAANLAPGYRAAQKEMQDLSLEQAQTRDVTAQAQQREMDVFNQKQQAAIFQRLARQRAQGQQTLSKADQQVQTLVETAGALLEGGQPAAAADLLNKASLIESRRATAQHQQTIADQILFNRRQEAAEVADEMWPGIKSQADQDAAATKFSERFPQTPNPFHGVYDPNAVKAQSDTSKAALAWNRDRRAQEELEQRIKNYRRLDRVAKEREHYDEEMLRIRRKQEERAAKGGVVKGPPPELQGNATNLVGDEFNNLPLTERKTIGWEIASRAMALTSTNRGMDQAEAVKAAIDERRGELQALDGMYKEKSGLFSSIREYFSPSRPLSAQPGKGETARGTKPIIGSVWPGEGGSYHRYIGGDMKKKDSWIEVTPEEAQAAGVTGGDEESDAVDAETGEPLYSTED